ncbi:MAG: type II toxin-antitoxin system VapC family toxin [Caulobacteraceae bacterium]
MSVVLDASALIAVLREEPGAARAEAAMDGAVMSTVNLAEVAAYLAKTGLERRAIGTMMAELSIVYAPPDVDLAIEAGSMRALTANAGLSLGDRFCLAQAKRLGSVALTADRAWIDVATALGVQVEIIR